MAGVIHRFHYLQLGLAVVLVFVGAKMLLTNVYKIPVGLALGVVAVVLGATVVASLLFPQRATAHDPVVHDPLTTTPDPAVAPIDADPEDPGDGRDRRGPA